MSLCLGACTEPGRRPPPNEDAVLVRGPEAGVALAVLADGMGGHRAGERASREALAIVERAAFAGGPPAVEEVAPRLRAAVSAAHARLRELAEADTSLAGMGCTIVLALVLDDRYWVGNVGDSRAYTVWRGRAEPITEDHTWVNARVQEGLLTPEQATVHPQRHMLEQALGAGEPPRLSLRPPAIARPGLGLVLCSDGVHEVLNADTIRRIVAQSSAAAAATALVQQAIVAGSRDNVSAVVLRWDGHDTADPEEMLKTPTEG